MPTAFRDLGLFDVLMSRPAAVRQVRLQLRCSEPAGPSVALLAKRRIHARLRRLATKPGEKSGLGHEIWLKNADWFRPEIEKPDCNKPGFLISIYECIYEAVENIKLS